MGEERRGYEEDWYPRPELNRDLRFRKPLLYPFELRGRTRLRKAAPVTHHLPLQYCHTVIKRQPNSRFCQFGPIGFRLQPNATLKHCFDGRVASPWARRDE
jgi:hypothetical protein